MLGAVWQSGRIELKERPIPNIKEDEVLIKVLASGICGTDLHVFSGKAQGKEGIIRGHEFSGRVIAVGRDVKSIKEGDLVAVDPNIYCGFCFYCKQGEVNLCENLRAIGVDIDGGFAEYCKVPFRQLYVLSENVSPLEAAMMEPLACAIHGIERVGVKLGDSVLIVGGGALGLILMQLAYIYGASKVIVVEPVENKRKVAKELGASYVINPLVEKVDEIVKELTGGRGADLGIEAVGKSETVNLVIQNVRKGGRVLIFGVSPVEDYLRVSPYEIYSKELMITGSFVNPYTNLRAVALIEEKRINVRKIISHTFPLREIYKAIELGLSGEALRIIISSKE